MSKLSLLILASIALPNVLLAQLDCLAGLNFDLPDTTEVSCQDCVTLTTSFPQFYATDSYSVQSIPYSGTPYPLNVGATVIGTIDDVWSNAIPLGFDFCFFGNTYSNVVIGSNGLVTFNAAQAGGYCPWAFGVAAPNAALPTNAIFAPYHDINPATCGNIRWQIYGEAPCRTFVVSFENVCMFSCSTLQSASQLVLYETSNIIEVYIVNKPACAGWNSGNTLIGIQNNTGTVAYVPPGRNTGNWVANAEAWQFNPAGAQLGEVTWYENELEIGTGASLEYCPEESSTIYAALSYNFCESTGGGDCANYAVNVSSGTWPGEVSWDLLTDGGVLVASGGAPYNQSLCLPNGCYTLNMYDSFGDGWNGAVFTITGEGGVITSATVPSGSFGTANFCVNDFVPEEEEEPAPIEAFLLDSTYVNVLFDDIDPGLDAAPLLCTYDENYQFTATMPDGVWESDCVGCLDENGLFDVANAEAGTYTVSYTITGDCGPVTDQVEVVVEAPPMLSLTGTDALCSFSDPIVIESNVVGGTFSADCGDCINGLTGEFNPQGLTAGTYTVSYTAGVNCPSTQSFEIQIDETITSEILTPEVMCESDTQTLLAELEGGLWTADCGACIDEGSGVFDATLSGSGAFEVQYTFDSFCAIETTAMVEVSESVDATITELPELCVSADPINLTAADPNGIWSADCGACLDANGQFSPQLSQSGEFTVVYSIEGVCSDTDEITVVVQDEVDATITPVSEICESESAFQLETADSGGVWSSDCGNCLSDNGIFDPSLSSGGAFTVSYEIVGVCSDSDEIVVNIAPAVDATIESIPDLCETGGSYDLSAEDVNGVWSSDCGDCLSADGEFNPQISLAGEYTVSYSITGVCSDSDQVSVVVLPQLDASIIIPEELCIDAAVYNPYAIDPGGVWDATCSGCIDSETGELDLAMAGEGDLTVFYEIDELCGDNDEVSIIIVPCSIEIPNIITPNNDGINDFLEFKNLEFFPGSRLEIRNRWGILIYENDSYNNSNNWRADGVSDGTYIFILWRGDGEVYQGNITVVRD